jgi:amino acid adenylation domain-containing protein
MLVEDLQPERDASRNPLFQVMFQLFSAVGARQAASDGRPPRAEVRSGTAKFDLFLDLWEAPHEVTGGIEYSTDLFDADTVARLAGHFRNLLEGMVADPERPLSQLPLLAPDEHRRLVVDWNATARPYPREACVHELFEAQAARTPDAPALVFGERTLSYAQLNERANRLAHRLRALGVGPDRLVGVCLERSLELPVALLAVLKAGGAYLPLDPGYPTARLAYMLADANAPVLLTQHQLRPRLPDGPAHTLTLDDEPPASSDDSSNPESGASADNLAYVIYTSGSTGTPKGVMATHRATVNRLAWMWNAHPFEADEVCCQKTALSFVDSVAELFGPLLGGIPLVVFPDEVVKDPQLLLRALSVHRVTRIVLVPSLLRALLDTGPELERMLAGLRRCITSGETLSAELARRFRERLPDCRLTNLYGSSEVSADATCFEVDHVPERMSVPIGRPIANTTVYVLDGHLQPVPLGVPGELFVGGAGLARGYLGRPELSAEKFVTHPLDGSSGSRLYRTGDRARWLADGNLEFLGRLDDQIKLRGFRIEPGEVEATLTGHDAVEAAVVISREDASGEPRLVAYVVASPEPPPTAGELRELVRRQLPDYMVPSAVVLLDELPLTQSGKVDRKVLPPPESARDDLDSPYIAPRTPVETVLSGLVSGVLELDHVGVHDDFFTDLGGHSLLAMQLMSRVRDSFDIDVPLRRLFEASTVAGLADALLEYAARRVEVERKAELLLAMSELSDDEVEQMLAARSAKGPAPGERTSAS